ncbi:MAG: uroporphyrinogen-III C-methyltransferase [Acidimicrobiia bacterium]
MNLALVGAGPGDPDLLTVRALRLIQQADVIVHDALVGTGVLDLAKPGTELIDVGKRPGRPVAQDAINDLLIELAATDRNIVRLKGGDPYVFGRGGEEAEALHGASIPFEVVPGVTSAFTAPLAIGVPVTHRGLAASVTVVTGHRRHGEPEPDWSAIAALVRSGGTVVVMMGVAQRSTIADALLAAGLDASTPVAISTSATLPHASSARCTLDSLGAATVKPPSVLVIGAVAAMDLRG